MSSSNEINGLAHQGVEVRRMFLPDFSWAGSDEGPGPTVMLCYVPNGTIPGSPVTVPGT